MSEPEVVNIELVQGNGATAVAIAHIEELDDIYKISLAAEPIPGDLGGEGESLFDAFCDARRNSRRSAGLPGVQELAAMSIHRPCPARWGVAEKRTS